MTFAIVSFFSEIKIVFLKQTMVPFIHGSFQAFLLQFYFFFYTIPGITQPRSTARNDFNSDPQSQITVNHNRLDLPAVKQSLIYAFLF